LSGIIWTIAVLGVAAIFIGVSCYRIVAIYRRPVHLRWELAPVPAEKAKSAYGGSHLEDPEYWHQPRGHSLFFQARYMAREILLLRGVWQHNRGLWPLSYSLHAGIYLLFLTVLLVIIDGVMIFSGAPAGGRGVFESVAAWPALAGYVLGAAGALGLLIKRAVDGGMRPFSTFTSYFNLALLAAISVSGAYGWFRGPAFFTDLGMFARELVTPTGMTPPAPALALHVGLFLAFLAYLPFSDMFHFAAKFFTYHEVRWDDRPLTVRMEKKLASQLSRPVGWSAGHIKAGTWKDIVEEKETRA
jgi:nitrate reductase gamma subunit